ncbi:MAG: hypothetical protein ACE5Z5_02735 [Candidatus Bathyarchaeia archaeon]
MLVEERRVSKGSGVDTDCFKAYLGLGGAGYARDDRLTEPPPPILI